MRANGLGWALGIGRLGGIAGPALGGDLLAPGLRPPIIFLSACGFILGAAVATALLRFREERVESLTISWPTIPTSITRGLARPEERRSPTRSGKRPASGFDYTLYSQLTLAGPEVRIHLPPAKSHVRTGAGRGSRVQKSPSSAKEYGSYGPNGATAEPVRHRQTKRGGYRYVRPTATASHLDYYAQSDTPRATADNGQHVAIT